MLGLGDRIPGRRRQQPECCYDCYLAPILGLNFETLGGLISCDLQRKMTGFLRRYWTFAFTRRRRPRKRPLQRLVGRRGCRYFAGAYGVLQETSAPRADGYALWDTLRSRKPDSLRAMPSQFETSCAI
jgi:hypothetical protein